MSEQEVWDEMSYHTTRVRMLQADLIAHYKEHTGPFGHTIGGSGPGSECCQYHEKRYAEAQRDLDDFEKRVREGNV